MKTTNDPWNASEAPSMDPFSAGAQSQLAEFDLLRGQIENNPPTVSNNNGTTSPNPFDFSGLDSSLPEKSETGTKPKKIVESLLGEHSNLVNLDNLVSSGKNPGINFGNSAFPLFIFRYYHSIIFISLFFSTTNDVKVLGK